MCSKGFLRIITHTIGIRQDGGRDVDEIHQMIKNHLRSLRDQNVDLKELLNVTQTEGQSYVSLCNEIHELGENADVENLTEDRLYIGLLLKAMRNETDKAKLLAESPETFAAARKFIINLETSRKGAKQISSPGSSQGHSVNAAKTTTYTKNKFDTSQKNNSGSATTMMTDGKSGGNRGGSSKNSKENKSCSRCGGSSHPLLKCPAKDKDCQSCGKKGHFTKVCFSKKSD